MASRNQKKRKNKGYSQRIRRLCYKVLRGNLSAELQLKPELNNPIAQKVILQVIKSAMKAKEKRAEAIKRFGIPSARIKPRSTTNYGNGYFPMQGGAPGSGRHS